MSELTTKEIAAKLQREDLTAAVYQDLLRAITARRRIVAARLSSIEDRNGAARRAAIETADSDAIAKLNQEAELLDEECGFLSHSEALACKLHVAATERETIEAGARAHRRLLSLIGAAESALATYLDARQQLQDATGAIAGANHLKRDARHFIVDDAIVERLIAAMWPLVRAEQLAGARAGIRQQICAPPPPVYGSPEPNLVDQVRDRMRR